MTFQTLPNQPLSCTGDRQINLSELKNKIVVLYFYPKDNTPGCTQESIDFNNLLAEFEKHKAVVIGISRDTLKSHERFKDKYDFNFDLIADPEEDLCNQFDVMKEKNMFGKKVRGIQRSTFVYNKKGELIKEWRKVKVPGHAEEVLNFVKSL